MSITFPNLMRRRSKADIAKPMHGLGPGISEIALAFRSDAFRVVYAVQIGEDIWVVHAFIASTGEIRVSEHWDCCRR
jgi:phage-related protein